MRKLSSLLTIAASAVFIVYGLDAIWKQSFIAIDGNRYYTIADDALITLRYGWNLANGNGLVWNTGEYVEGTTSLLWALYSATLALFLDKRLLPLSIQVSSIVFLLLTGFVFRNIFQHCINKSLGYFDLVLLELIAFLTPLSYYFFIAWSFRGMETSLQGFLIALAVYFIIKNKEKPSITASSTLGLCYLARPDSVVLAAVIFIFRGFQVLKKNILLRQLFIEMMPFVLIFMGATIFRYTYYGSLVPNTYTLKVTGMTVFERITLNGIGYIIPFILMTWPLLVAVLVSILLRPTFEKCMFAFLPLSMIVYVIYIGGDAFQGWRFLAPYMPYAFLVLLQDWSYFNRKYCSIMRGKTINIALYGLTTIIILIIYFVIGRPPFASFTNTFRYPQQDDMANINTAIYLNRILRNDASVGVFYCGSIPFYTGLKAYDFLGKCDPYIASLSPDLSGAMATQGMFSMPGHNKYDLQHSILKKLPTFVEGFKFGRQNVTQEANKFYIPVHVTFTTWSSFDKNTILLLKESSNVKWGELKEAEEFFSRNETEFAQNIEVKSPRKSIRVNKTIKMPVEVKNISSQTWSSSSIRLSYHWLDKTGKIIVYNGERTFIPQDIAPGQSIMLNALVKAPDIPGEYILQLTMVKELVAWFEDRGAKPLNIPVIVKRK